MEVQQKMKKTYIQPRTTAVWLGLVENVLDNVGGMDVHSNGRTSGSDTNWVKGEQDWGGSAGVTTPVTPNPNLWDDEW